MSEDHDEKEHKHCPFCGHHIDEEDMICLTAGYSFHSCFFLKSIKQLYYHLCIN